MKAACCTRLELMDVNWYVPIHLLVEEMYAVCLNVPLGKRGRYRPLADPDRRSVNRLRVRRE